MKKFFLFAFLLLLFAGFPGLAGAQGLGVKISPVKIEDIVEPGKTYKYQVKLANPSNLPIILYAGLKDFKAKGEGGDAVLIAPGSEEGSFLTSWIDISEEGIDFAPNEERIIDFYVNVPAETGPGGYYGGVFFGTKAPKLNLDSEDKGAGMAIAQQTGTLLLFQVKGDVAEDASIREFNTDKEVYNTPFEVNFLTRIENRGNVHVKPAGQINISNMFGQEAAVMIVNEGGGNVLPGQIRAFKNSWADEFGFGRYKAVIGLSYGTAVDLGGQGRQTLYTEKYFWIMPWKIILPIFAAIIGIFLVFALFLRFYKNKAVRKAMAQAGLISQNQVKYYKAGPSATLHMFMILMVVSIVVILIVVGFYFLFLA